MEPDRFPISRDRKITLCFSQEPDLELEGLLKRHYTTVEFFQGSMMAACDLERVKVSIPLITVCQLLDDLQYIYICIFLVFIIFFNRLDFLPRFSTLLNLRSPFPSNPRTYSLFVAHIAASWPLMFRAARTSIAFDSTISLYPSVLSCLMFPRLLRLQSFL